MHMIDRLITFKSLVISIFKVAGDDFEVIFVTLIDAIKAAHVAVTCVQPNNIFPVSRKPEGGTLLRYDLLVYISLGIIHIGLEIAKPRSFVSSLLQLRGLTEA